MSHTPGPWKNNDFTIEANDRELNHDGIPYTDIIAHVYAGNENDLPNGEDKANAQLIAAAPELLDALEDTVSSLAHYIIHVDGIKALEEAAKDTRTSSIARARAAIAKAKGEESK